LSIVGIPVRSPAPDSSRQYPLDAIVAAVAAAWPLPFDMPGSLDAATLGWLRPTSPTRATLTRRAAAHHAAQPNSQRDDGAGPDAPSSPPGNVTAAGIAAAFANSSSGYCCAILSGLLALSLLRLPRHRVRPLGLGPVGVASLLQRPG
jgi:hypothetical protein